MKYGIIFNVRKVILRKKIKMWVTVYTFWKMYVKLVLI